MLRPMTDARAATLPAWPLPAACAALPFLATWVAFALSAEAGHIVACNPFWDGCTSISRAARHGLGNHVFRAAVLPAATLQTLTWMVAAAWLRRQQRATPVQARFLVVLGAIAGLALVLYATFLGSDGEVYRLLRRHGVHVYFAASYLALLLMLRALSRAPADRARRPLLVIAIGMLLLGVASTAVTALVADAALKDRLENALEWQLGLLLTAMFVAIAWRWRRQRWAPAGD